MKQFIIYYKVQVGNADKRDVAIVRAMSEESAVKNLKAFIRNQSSSIKIADIYLVKEYKGSIFTRNFGQDD